MVSKQWMYELCYAGDRHWLSVIFQFESKSAFQLNTLTMAQMVLDVATLCKAVPGPYDTSIHTDSRVQKLLEQQRKWMVSCNPDKPTKVPTLEDIVDVVCEDKTPKPFGGKKPESKTIYVCYAFVRSKTGDIVPYDQAVTLNADVTEFNYRDNASYTVNPGYKCVRVGNNSEAGVPGLVMKGTVTISSHFTCMDAVNQKGMAGIYPDRYAKYESGDKKLKGFPAYSEYTCKKTADKDTVILKLNCGRFGYLVNRARVDYMSRNGWPIPCEEDEELNKLREAISRMKIKNEDGSTTPITEDQKKAMQVQLDELEATATPREPGSVIVFQYYPLHKVFVGKDESKASIQAMYERAEAVNARTIKMLPEDRFNPDDDVSHLLGKNKKMRTELLNGTKMDKGKAFFYEYRPLSFINPMPPHCSKPISAADWERYILPGACLYMPSFIKEASHCINPKTSAKMLSHPTFNISKGGTVYWLHNGAEREGYPWEYTASTSLPPPPPVDPSSVWDDDDDTTADGGQSTVVSGSGATQPPQDMDDDDGMLGEAAAAFEASEADQSTEPAKKKRKVHKSKKRDTAFKSDEFVAEE